MSQILSTSDFETLVSEVTSALNANANGIGSLTIYELLTDIVSLPCLHVDSSGKRTIGEAPLELITKVAEAQAALAQAASVKAEAAADNADEKGKDLVSYISQFVEAVADCTDTIDEAKAAIASILSYIQQSITSSQQAQDAATAADTAAQDAAAKTALCKTATTNALSVSDHPTYVGTDNYVYKWDLATQAYVKTDIFVKGDTGNSGVEINTTEPTDPNVDVWIDPDGESNTKVVDTISHDESITSPANMYGDVNGSVIKKIRSLHRRCLAKYLGDGKMAICYLQDDNSNFYSDGTSAALDGTEGDVMVYRPSYSHLFERIDENRFKVSFSLIALGGMWKNVDACLIGAYEAYSVNNKLYSRSGVASAGSISQTNFKAYARARGTGYQIIDYDMHKEIPWLFYALYGTRNCQAVCGSGTNAYDKQPGQTNGIGNTDTTTANGNTMSVNFLGLENCWGNKYEFLDNVIYNPDSGSLGVWQITDTKTGATRRVQGLVPTNAWAWPKKMAAGDELDIIETESGLSDSTGYCDGQYLSTSLSRVVMRSGSHSSSYGGVASANTGYGASDAVAAIGSRLAFRGEIIVYESVAAFKALSVVN